jgi:predicted porin
MKKSLLALAALGAFVGTAQAQSSVSVYGLYDGGYNSNVRTTKIGTATPTVISNSNLEGNQQSSSRLGFRGVEDLGKGLTANFNLELGFNPGTGSVDTVTLNSNAHQSQSDSVRTAVVGLNSKAFGELRVGRQLTGIFTTGAGDIFGGSNMVGDIIASSHAGAGATNTTDTRVYRLATRMNGASYFTPNFSGFTARLDFSNNLSTGQNVKADGTANTQPTQGIANANILSGQVANQGLSAKYVYGPVTLAAGTHKVATNTNVTTATGAVTETRINIASIMFKQGPFTAQITHGQNKSENKQTALQTTKVSANRFAVQYEATPAIVPFAMYGTGKTDMTVAAPVTADNTAYLVGANYHLSKRTRLYGVYGFQKSDVKSTTTTAETKEYGLGVVHTF